MSKGYAGRRRTRSGDVVITETVESTVDGTLVVDVYVGEPASWSSPAFRVINPPQMVVSSGGNPVDDQPLALAESVAAAGGVMIVRGRR